MKIIIDYGDGRTSTFEDVIDYGILAKDDLVDAVNNHFNGEGIDRTYDDLSDENKDELWSRVKKNCGYYDSLPSMETFYDEVESVMNELGLFDK